jgi:uncharacterized damage-inducible protein DinB
MNAIFGEHLNLLQTLHTGIQKELDGLPVQALDWVPAEGANSLSVLIAHVAGSERYWIGDVIMGENSNRDRAAEFRTSGLASADLTRRLDETLAYARSALERLDLADLERECLAPGDGRRVSASWALLHALEHTALHLGHIQLTRQLWDQK